MNKLSMKWMMGVFFVIGAAFLAGLMSLAGGMPVDQAGAVNDGSGVCGLALLVNGASINAIFTGLKTTFNKAFDGAASTWEKTAMKIPSSTREETYAWLSRFPKMRKWIGDKVFKNLEAFSYTVKNEPYEATINVKRDDIEDDQLGQYGIQAQDAGFSAKSWPDEMVSELKNNAFAAECYDGQYFYDTDHPVSGASVSNKGTAALSAASLAAVQASYGAARTAIMSFKDDDGRPLGVIPNVLEVPPALEAVAKLICTSQKLGDDTPNPFVGTAEVIVNPLLTSSTAWFLHATNRPIKPFVFQERKAPTLVSQTSPDSDDVFNRALYNFSVEARGNAGYGLWQLSYGSTGLG